MQSKPKKGGTLVQASINYVDCLSGGDGDGAGGSRDKVGDLGVLVRDRREDVAGGPLEDHCVRPWHHIGEDVVAVGIRGGRGDDSGALPQLHGDTAEPRLPSILDAVAVGVLPHLVANTGT